MKGENALPWTSVIAKSLDGVYTQLVDFLPVLIVAILVLVFGWAIAILLGKIVSKVLALLKVDELAGRLGLAQLSERVGRHLTISGFGNWLVKWFFLIVTFVATADILGLNQVGEFLFGSVLPYFGDVVIAVAIMVIGVVAANFMRSVVLHTLKASQLGRMDSLAALTQWAIVIFSVLAALSQLKVATSFIQDLFRAIVAMLAIAGGIAFGMGGREHAKEVLDKISRHFK